MADPTILFDDLPEAFRVHDGYVPEPVKDINGALIYPTANPALGPRPDWFGGNSLCWIMQCGGCDLLVVARTNKGCFDDYEGMVPHKCTNRKPGETVDEAQRRLIHSYFLLKDAEERRVARGDIAPAVVEEDE